MRIIALCFVFLLAGCVARQVCPVPVVTNATCPECRSCAPCPAVDINSCPQITIVKNLTYTKYVCPNGLTVEDVDKCFPVLNTNVTPVTTNEKGVYIKNVSVKPACVYGVNGGVIRFTLGTIARNITVQVKNMADYVDVYSSSNLDSGFIYFTLGDQVGSAGFKLQRNKIYLLRVQFVLPAINKTQYSNEHVIDTRQGADYTLRKCN